MRKTLAPLALTALLIAGCSSAETDTPTSGTPVTEALTTTTAENTDTQTALGETNKFTCTDPEYPCDIDFTIEEIALDQTCPEGVAGYWEHPTHEENQIFITIIGNTTVNQAEWNGDATIDGFGIRDADGFTHEAKTAFGCESDAFEEWGNVRVGDSAQGRTTLLIPDSVTELLVRHVGSPESYTYDLTGIEVGPGGGEPEMPLVTETPLPDTPSAEPAQSPVIGMTEAPGAAQPSAMSKTIESCGNDPMMYQPGTTFFTDGTTGWTEYCANGGQ